MSEVFDIIGEFSDMCGAHVLYRFNIIGEFSDMRSVHDMYRFRLAYTLMRYRKVLQV